MPTGEVYLAKLPRDGKLDFKHGEIAMIVNLQGAPGPLDSMVQLLTLGLMRSTDK